MMSGSSYQSLAEKEAGDRTQPSPELALGAGPGFDPSRPLHILRMSKVTDKMQSLWSRRQSQSSPFHIRGSVTGPPVHHTCHTSTPRCPPPSFHSSVGFRQPGPPPEHEHHPTPQNGPPLVWVAGSRDPEPTVHSVRQGGPGGPAPQRRAYHISGKSVLRPSQL